MNTPIGEITSFVNDTFTREMKQRGYYAEQLILDDNLRPIIEKSNVILDIGGHVGYHSIAYNKFNPSAKIMTFEPQNSMFLLLESNVKANKLDDKIKVFNLAVGDKIRKTTLSNKITDGLHANTQLEYGTNKEFNLAGLSIGFDGEVVEMITVDSLMLESLDYMKIDVEGAEILVLMGAEETIKKFKPIICFEYNHKKISPEFLKSLGYDKTLPTPFKYLETLGYTKFESLRYENFIAT